MEFSRLENINLSLYTTNKTKTKETISKIGNVKATIYEGYETGICAEADIIINCIGAGTPKNMNNDYTPWFTLLEKFDNLCIDYIKTKSDTLYVSLSSGSIYGANFSKASRENTKNNVEVNNMGLNNFYSITKLYSEAKHRAYKDLNIVDLRIFSFFSRFSNINDGYLLTDIAKAVKNKTTLETNEVDIVRDYVNPEDLTELILKCASKEKINTAIDIRSKAPVGKFELLSTLEKEFGLKYKIKKDLNFKNSSGTKNIYYSKRKPPEIISEYKAKYTSVETIIQELKVINSEC